MIDMASEYRRAALARQLMGLEPLEADRNLLLREYREVAGEPFITHAELVAQRAQERQAEAAAKQAAEEELVAEAQAEGFMDVEDIALEWGWPASWWHKVYRVIELAGEEVVCLIPDGRTGIARSQRTGLYPDAWQRVNEFRNEWQADLQRKQEEQEAPGPGRNAAAHPGRGGAQGRHRAEPPGVHGTATGGAGEGGSGPTGTAGGGLGEGTKGHRAGPGPQAGAAFAGPGEAGPGPVRVHLVRRGQERLLAVPAGSAQFRVRQQQLPYRPPLGHGRPGTVRPQPAPGRGGAGRNEGTAGAPGGTGDCRGAAGMDPVGDGELPGAADQAGGGCPCCGTSGTWQGCRTSAGKSGRHCGRRFRRRGKGGRWWTSF